MIKTSKIISSPNCIAIPLALSLHPLLKLTNIELCCVTTYQSVSGAGAQGLKALAYEQKDLDLQIEEQKKYLANIINITNSKLQNEVNSLKQLTSKPGYSFNETELAKLKRIYDVHQKFYTRYCSRKYGGITPCRKLSYPRNGIRKAVCKLPGHMPTPIGLTYWKRLRRVT